MKYTVITGATGGIGKLLAKVFAKAGHHLIVSSRNEKELFILKSELENKFGVTVHPLVCDLSRLEETETVFKAIKSEFEIDCLINNAGTGRFASIGEITMEDILFQEHVNVIAPILITSLLLPSLNANNGCVINICSVLSYLPNLKASIYTAGKHALSGFSDTLRLENPRLSVLSVYPSTVRTGFFKDETYFKKIRLVLEPEQVAEKIFSAYQKRKKRLYIPKTVWFLKIFYSLFPNLTDRVNRKFFANK